MLVRCLGLTFRLGALEPVFGTLSLWDVERKIKLSEDFHFDLNDEQFLRAKMGPKMVGGGGGV